MKHLTKIKVINWHLFENQTVDVLDNMLIVGENASGKSTLLDAIQFVLTTGKREFNKAAHEKGKRNLESYVRGKIGVEEMPFLRTGYVVSHIALEFLSDVHQVLGVVIESPSAGKAEKVYFYKVDARLDESWFIDADRAIPYRDFKRHIEGLGLEFTSFDSRHSSRRMFANTLGVDPRYFDLVPKALSFKPINNLHQFIFDYLLNERSLEVDTIRESIRDYRTMRTQFMEYERRHEKLGQIVDVHHGMGERHRLTHVYEVADNLNSAKIIESNAKGLQVSLEKNALELSGKNRERERLNAQLIKDRDSYYEIRNVLEGKNDYVRVDELNRKKVIVERDLNDSELDFTDFTQRYGTSKRDFSLISNSWHLPDLDVMRDASKGFEVLSRLEKGLTSVQNELLNLNYESDKKLKEVENDRNRISSQLENLNRRQFTYRPNVTNLREFLIESLSDHFNEKVRVDVFCEVIEVLDETWRNALEGFLNTQRFNLIVEKKYYVQALLFFDAFKDKMNFYGVGLVDIEKVQGFDTHDDNSLASKINGLNSNAQRYANYLMGKVMCVETVADLRNHKRSITASCVVYSGYVSSGLHPKNYRTPYIGLKALDMQKVTLTEELRILNEAYSNLKAEISKQAQTGKIVEALKSHDLQRYYRNYLKHLDELINLEAITKELSAIKVSSETLVMLEKQDALSASNYALEEEIKKIDHRVGTLDSAIISEQKQLDEVLEIVEKNRTTIVAYELEHIDYLADVHAYLDGVSLKRLNNLALVKKDIDVDRTTNDAKINELNFELKGLMRNYENETHSGFGYELENIGSYLKQFQRIDEIELRKTQDNLLIAQKKSEDMFAESFINGLKKNIEEAQRNIKDLNHNLKRRQFGNDRYEFVIGASSEPEFRDYYKIIMSGQSHEQTDLFMENLSEVNAILMQSLFDKIALFDADQSHEAQLQKYTDYRYYMNYDIVIHHENGNKTYFSKVSQEKSGGETQVPFYVIIASSFEQLIKTRANESSACVVLFDEAFNNMDEGRIKAMMQFYNALKIQVIIAVPPNRVETIRNFVQTIVGVGKHENYANVKVYKGVADEPN